jgi:hypothetical protein
MLRKTNISIYRNAFYINNQPTYFKRYWQGCKVEGLLMNARLVQGIFDDLNENTRPYWNYPDDGEWNPERNTNEFISAMPEWRDYGLLAFTINLQGGNPRGYSQTQPWHNSAITETGHLRAEYMKRLERIIDKADEIGMVVMLGIYYFGQAYRLHDERTIRLALDNVMEWIFDHNYKNILVEINNECNIIYTHPILKPPRVTELIEQVKTHTLNGERILVGTSYSGGAIPDSEIISASDFILLHGNGVQVPAGITSMILQTRQVAGYTHQPILFNEDDHYNFDQPVNNYIAAVREYASWGFFDYRMPGEGLNEGYQSVPVNWGISSSRKQGFFNKTQEITANLGHG